ncbi:hypothetical protein HHI36_001439 [Cryptolaemus montrouzieri]|uniref:Uncharacterized protein n=1 Tax=Cryptolaemus montrouzieri TaxID=559131 RepID=A0ABD2P7L7_9CUCU
MPNETDIFQEVQSCFTEFEDVHSQIALLDKTEVTDEDVGNFEDEFYKAIGDAETFMLNLPQPTNTNNSTNSKNSIASSSQVLKTSPDVLHNLLSAQFNTLQLKRCVWQEICAVLSPAGRRYSCSDNLAN